MRKQATWCVFGALAFWEMGLMASDSQIEPNLINGREVRPGEFSEVVRLNMGCTGTVVGPRIVITAAHCFGDHPVKAVNGSFKIGDELYKGKFSSAPKWGRYELDVAVGFMEREITGVRFGIVGGKVEKGAKATHVGYGCIFRGGTGGNDGILRVGDATITNTTARGFPVGNYYFQTGRPGEAALCFGDSGGPTFMQVKNGETEYHYLIGINSRGNIEDHSWLQKTQVPDAQAFLKTFAESNHVEICGINIECDQELIPEPIPEPTP